MAGRILLEVSGEGDRASEGVEGVGLEGNRDERGWDEERDGEVN